MAKGRRSYFVMPDSILTDGLDDSTIADLARLSAYLNSRWARNGLKAEEAGTAIIGPQEAMLITNTSSPTRARARLQTLADRAAAARMSVTTCRVGRTVCVGFDWPKFVEYQHYLNKERASCGQVAGNSVSPASASALEEETNDAPAARAKPSRRPPPSDSPEWVTKVYAALPGLPLLDHPSLYDWSWWAKVHLAYPLDNGKIDVVHELKKMQAYYTSNPARCPKKNWKTATFKWIGRALTGPPWLQPGATERDRFMKDLHS